MTEIVGGSSVASVADVMRNLNGSLIIPDFEGKGTPAPVTTAAPKPQVVLNPNPTVVNSAPVVEENKLSTSVELPDFVGNNGSEPGNSAPVTQLEDGALREDKLEQDTDEDTADLPANSAPENFKKLRGITKSLRVEKRELESQLKTLSNKVEKYEKGEVVPEIIRAKDERIAHLEKYEKMVDFQNSREYQETFVTPSIRLREKLHKLGTDYGIPAQVMDQAVNVENKKELGAFLSSHFADVDALEAKQIITELHDIARKSNEAEQNSEQSLQQIRQNYLENEKQETAKRVSVFENTAKDAWGKALEKTKAEGAYKELILHPTDTDYNKKVVEPIQYKASVQYGALIRKLHENGLKTLPPELANGMARMVLLSIGGAITMDAKVKAETTANTLIQNTKRTNGYVRPVIGGQNGAGHSNKGSGVREPLTPESAAKAALNVFNK